MEALTGKMAQGTSEAEKFMATTIQALEVVEKLRDKVTKTTHDVERLNNTNPYEQRFEHLDGRLWPLLLRRW